MFQYICLLISFSSSEFVFTHFSNPDCDLYIIYYIYLVTPLTGEMGLCRPDLPSKLVLSWFPTTTLTPSSLLPLTAPVVNASSEQHTVTTQCQWTANVVTNSLSNWASSLCHSGRPHCECNKSHSSIYIQMPYFIPHSASSIWYPIIIHTEGH